MNMSRAITATGALLAGAFWGPALFAQDSVPPRLGFDVSTRLGHASNPSHAP